MSRRWNYPWTMLIQNDHRRHRTNCAWIFQIVIEQKHQQQQQILVRMQQKAEDGCFPITNRPKLRLPPQTAQRNHGKYQLSRESFSYQLSIQCCWRWQTNTHHMRMSFENLPLKRLRTSKIESQSEPDNLFCSAIVTCTQIDCNLIWFSEWICNFNASRCLIWVFQL